MKHYPFSLGLLIGGFLLGLVLAGWLDRLTIARNADAIGRLAQDSEVFQVGAQAFLEQLQAQVTEERARNQRMETALARLTQDQALAVAQMRRVFIDTLTPDEQVRLEMRERLRQLEEPR